MKRSYIDVIVVTKNRHPKLLKCVRHICLNSIKPSSLIIIDSGAYKKAATDKITSLCKNSGVPLKYFRIPHRGVGFSRNEGLKKVESFYFAFLDDDEYAPKYWLENIFKVFRKLRNIQVLAGPKIPQDRRNYWHRVWRSLTQYEYDYEGEVDTIPSGNSIYLTSFIKKHNLRYDSRFKQCSEDQAFSLELRKKKANIYFHKSVWVKHDLRRDFASFIKQWFFYGMNKFLYHQLYLGSGSVIEPRKIGRTLRNLKSTFPYKGNLSSVYVWPGLVLLNCVFLVGFLYSFLGLNKIYPF